MVYGVRMKAVKQHEPPERLKHVFDFYGLKPADTPERAEMVYNGGVGVVYLIGCDGYVKIGLTNGDPQQRTAFLQIGSPHELKLLKVFRTEHPILMEGWLHRRYARVYVRGEWFKLPDDVVSELLGVDDFDAWMKGKGEDEI